MQQISAIEHFLEVMRQGNFSRAARALGISAVAISKSMASLEASSGVRLFERSTRSVRATPEAHQFYEQCQGPIEALQAAQRHLHSRAVNSAGVVRITCLKPFGKHYLIPALQDFLQAQRSVQVQVSLDDRPVDLIAQGFDLGIRATMQPPPQVIARDICALPLVLCASPEYFSRHGVPANTDALKTHQCLRLMLGSQALTSMPGEQAKFEWTVGAGTTSTLGAKSTSTQSIAVQGNLAVDDFLGLEAAALAGIGIFQAPLPLVLPHFRAGALRPILPQTLLAGRRLVLHYRSRKNQSLRVKLLIEHLLQSLRQHRDLSAHPEQLCQGYWLQA